MISGMMTQTKEKTILHGFVYGNILDPTGGNLAAITPCKYLSGFNGQKNDRITAVWQKSRFSG
jgi:hypothetical protein